MNGDAQQPDASGNWQYKPDDADPQPQAFMAQAPQPEQVSSAPNPASTVQVERPAAEPVVESKPDVSWTATEFIAHEKTPLWYLALIVATALLAALVKLISHDNVSMVVIIVIGVIIWVTAGRQPRSLQYLLDAKGVTVNRAFRAYGEFKSFAIVQEEQLNSIVFLPLKRFTLPLSLHVSPEETDQVVAKLSDYLPNDQAHGHDSMDRFVQRMRF